MPLSIRLFGQPRLLVDAQPYSFNTPPKTFPLLAYLLLHRAAPIPRQQVAFQLWPDDTESAARANLRRHLYHLVHALPPCPDDQPWVLLTPSSVQWNPQSRAWLDEAEFERLAAREETLADAVALYEGDLLETLYEDWVFFERERLRELYFGCLTRLVHQLRTRRDFVKALEFARQLVGRDPFREDALRQIMGLRYEMGDRAGAIQEYELFTRRLKQEMGVAPMPETQALYESVVRNQGLGAASQNPPESDRRPETLPALPFVGRENEIARLETAWSRAAHGHGSLLLVGGEAGVGKTRLLQELAQRVERQGGRILKGGTSPGEPRPYQAVVEALQSALPMLASIQGAREHLAALAVLVPEISARLKIPRLAALDPEPERLRLFHAAATCLEKLSEPRPLLLVLEDLHWAGKALCDLLEFLARRAIGLPMLVVASYREEETPRPHPLRALRRRLQAEGLVEHLAAGRLGPAAVQALLAEPAVRGRLPEHGHGDLPAHLYTESEGNPLFMELLLRHWQETGQVSAGGTPGGIREAVLRQVQRAPAEARAYAEVAAVIGTAFDPEVVREVGGWGEAQALDALQALLDCRLVSDTTGRSYAAYCFSHHLIQASLYAGIPPRKRKQRHLRAGEILEEFYPDQPAELAFHFDQGGDSRKAAGCYEQAARNFLEMYAYNEALDAANRAIALAQGSGDSRKHGQWVNLHLLRETLYDRQGLRAEQKNDLETLERLAFEQTDPELSFQVLEREILYYRRTGDLPECRNRIQKLKQIAWEHPAPLHQADALYYEGFQDYNEGHYGEAITALRGALDLYHQAGERQKAARCCCVLAEIGVQTRDVAQVDHWVQQAQAASSQDGLSEALMHTWWSAAAAGLIQKNLPACLSYGQKLLEAAEQAHDLIWQSTAHRILGQATRRLFRMADSRRHLETTLELNTRLQRPKGQCLALESLATLEQALGRFEEAHHYNQRALKLYERLNQPANIAILLINTAETYFLQGQYPQVKETLVTALRLTREVKNRFLEAAALQVLGKAERELGEWAHAGEHLAQALGIFASCDQQVEWVTGLGDLCLVHLCQGNLDLALREADDVIRGWPDIQNQSEDSQRTLWAAVQALRAAGQTERAHQELSRAHQVVLDRLNSLPEDPSLRESYCRIPFNAQILSAYRQEGSS